MISNHAKGLSCCINKYNRIISLTPKENKKCSFFLPKLNLTTMVTMVKFLSIIKAPRVHTLVYLVSIKWISRRPHVGFFMKNFLTNQLFFINFSRAIHAAVLLDLLGAFIVPAIKHHRISFLTIYSIFLCTSVKKQIPELVVLS